MARTVFPTFLDNFVTAVGASGYTHASGTLPMATGSGALLLAKIAAEGQSSISSTHRLRIAVATSNAEVLVFEATALSGDSLTGAVVEGTDQDFAALTKVYAGDTSGLMRVRQTAIHGLEDVVYSPSWVPAPTTGDQGAILQAAVDAPATGAASVRFPVGSWPLGTPVYLDRSDLSVKGLGRGATNVGGGDYAGGGGFVVGLRRVYEDGRHILSAHRPDCHGVLDSGAAATAGVRAGLSTQGNICGVMVARDRMETWTGITVQFPINSTALTGEGQALFGYDPTRNYGPYFVSTYLDPTVFKMMVWFSDGTMREMHASVGATAGLARIRMWMDFATGTYGATRDGSSVSVNLNGGASFAGLTMLANRTHLPFMVGVADWVAKTEGGTPNFTLYGLRVSKLAITSEPSGDLAKYFNESPNDAVMLPLTDVTPARHLKVDLAGGFNNLFLPHSNGLDTPVDNVSISDLSIGGVENGILLGMFQRFNADNVGSLCGSNGAASLPVYFSYLATFHNCEFAGGQAGFTFAQIIRMSMVGVDVKDGGPYTQATFRGCSADWAPSMLLEPSGAETYVDIWNGDYGGVYRIAGLVSDSEGAGISVAGVRIETHAQCQTDVQFEQVTFGTLGPTAVAIHLIGHTGASYPGAAVRANGLLSGDATAAGAVRCVGAGWYGEVDARGLSVKTKLGGTDAALVTVRTT